MFTGLVEEGGRVAEVRPAGGGARLAIAASAVLEGLRVGDSGTGSPSTASPRRSAAPPWAPSAPATG